MNEHTPEDSTVETHGPRHGGACPTTGAPHTTRMRLAGRFLAECARPERFDIVLWVLIAGLLVAAFVTGAHTSVQVAFAVHLVASIISWARKPQRRWMFTLAGREVVDTIRAVGHRCPNLV